MSEDWADGEALRLSRALDSDGYDAEVQGVAESALHSTGGWFGQAPRDEQLAFVAGLRVMWSDVYGVESLIRIGSLADRAS